MKCHEKAIANLNAQQLNELAKSDEKKARWSRKKADRAALRLERHLADCITCGGAA